MSADKFDMLIRVPTALVGPVFELITGQGDVLEVRPTSQGPARRRRAASVRKPIEPGMPRKHMRGMDLILDIMAAGHEWDYDRLRAEFIKAGKAANSMSPCLSKRLADGSIIKLGPSIYRIAPKGGAA